MSSLFCPWLGFAAASQTKGKGQKAKGIEGIEGIESIESIEGYRKWASLPLRRLQDHKTTSGFCVGFATKV